MGNCNDNQENLYDEVANTYLDEIENDKIMVHTAYDNPKKLKLGSHKEFCGEMQNDKAEGKGHLETEDYTYKGSWKNGKPNGYGEILFNNGNVYKGDILNGEPHGHGEYKRNNGTVYMGNFKYGKYDGYGEVKWPNGSKYKGEFKKGLFNGDGEFMFEDGRIFKGKYVNGQKHGDGCLYLPNGSELEGVWRYGEIRRKKKYSKDGYEIKG